MIKNVVGVFACALALGLAACGGDDDNGGGSALAKGDLAKKANEICAKYDKEAEKVKQPTNVANANDAAPYFRSIADIGAKRQGELEDLEPASDVKSDYAAFIASQKELVDIVDQIATAAEGKDAQKGAQLLQQAQTLDKPSEDAAKKIGANSCG